MITMRKDILNGTPDEIASKLKQISKGISRHEYLAGIAGALKTTAINWALANGYTELHTSNEERNTPINRLNARLGYRPGIGRIHLVGPIIGGLSR